MKQLFDLAYRWYEPTLLLQKKDETAIGLFNTIRCLMNNVAMAVLSLSTSTLSVPNDQSDARSRAPLKWEYSDFAMYFDCVGINGKKLELSFM